MEARAKADDTVAKMAAVDKAAREKADRERKIQDLANKEEVDKLYWAKMKNNG